jgi:hypothetical protein
MSASTKAVYIFILLFNMMMAYQARIYRVDAGIKYFVVSG